MVSVLVSVTDYAVVFVIFSMTASCVTQYLVIDRKIFRIRDVFLVVVSA